MSTTTVKTWGTWQGQLTAPAGPLAPSLGKALVRARTSATGPENKPGQHQKRGPRANPSKRRSTAARRAETDQKCIENGAVSGPKTHTKRTSALGRPQRCSAMPHILLRRQPPLGTGLADIYRYELVIGYYDVMIVCVVCRICIVACVDSSIYAYMDPGLTLPSVKGGATEESQEAQAAPAAFQGTPYRLE